MIMNEHWWTFYLKGLWIDQSQASMPSQPKPIVIEIGWYLISSTSPYLWSFKYEEKSHNPKLIV